MISKYSVISPWAEADEAFEQYQKGNRIDGTYYSEQVEAILCLDTDVSRVVDALGATMDDWRIDRLEDFLTNVWEDGEEEMEISYDYADPYRTFSISINGLEESCCEYFLEADVSTFEDWYLELKQYAKILALQLARDTVRSSIDQMFRQVDPGKYDGIGRVKASSGEWISMH